MPSERQKNAGYVLPAAITGHNLLCVQLMIPDVKEYRAAFLGALYELTKWWNWEKSWQLGDRRATDAASYWLELLTVHLAIDGCEVTPNMFDVRQNPTLPCKLEKTEDGLTWVEFADLQKCPPKVKSLAGRLFYSGDGGTTWQPVQEDDYTTYDWKQDEPLRPARTGDNKKCLAAANAVAVFVELHRQMVNWYNTSATGVGIAIAIQGIIAFLFPVSAPFIMPAIAGEALAVGLLQHAAALNNPAFTQEIQDQLRCIFWTHADDDGRWSEAAFNLVLADVGGRAGDMWALLGIYLGQIGGYTGLNNAGTTTSVTAADCGDCAETWCYVFDFSVSDGGWQVVGGGAYANGHWESTCYFTNAWYTVVQIRLNWPDNFTELASIDVEYDAAPGTGNAQNTYITRDGSMLVQHNPTHFGVGQTLSATGLSGVPGYIDVYASSDAWPDASRCNTGYTHIKRVTLRGPGQNPFGTDNCT